MLSVNHFELSKTFLSSSYKIKFDIHNFLNGIMGLDGGERSMADETSMGDMGGERLMGGSGLSKAVSNGVDFFLRPVES